MSGRNLFKFLLWAITISYMLLIFYLSQLSSPLPVSLPSGLDKVLHFFEYAVLGCLLYISLRYSGNRYPLFLALLLANSYAFTDEFHQYFIPMRDASLLDLFSDIAGATVAVLTTERIITKTKVIPEEKNDWTLK